MPLHTQFPIGYFSPNAIQKLLAKFVSTGSAVGIFRDSATYFLAHDLGSGRYLTYEWYAASYLADATIPTIRNIAIHRPCLSVAETTFTRSGTWVTGLGSAFVYSGTYMRSNTTGDYAEWTTPAGVEWIGTWTLFAGNAGVCKVTIDGDATLANLLPTAQQLVTAGTLPSTVLVANGGTLNPTDRVWDQSSGPSGDTTGNNVILMAEGLSAGSHTVRLIVTGYKNSGSSDTRLYLAGGAYGGTIITTIATANIRMLRATTLSTAASRWEYALSYTAQGSATTDWVGHSNTSFTTSFSLEVDSVSQSPAAWSCYSGNQIVLTLNSYHKLAAWNGGNNVATAVTTYTLSPSSGLTVSWTLTWLCSGTSDVAYPAMLPLGSIFDKGSNLQSTSDFTLSADNNSVIANHPSQAAYLWDTDGNYGALIYMPNLDPVLQYRLCSGLYLWIEDRTGGSINKIYATRNNSTPVNISVNDVWSNSGTNFRVKYFASGANAVLAR